MVLGFLVFVESLYLFLFLVLVLELSQTKTKMKKRKQRLEMMMMCLVLLEGLEWVLEEQQLMGCKKRVRPGRAPLKDDTKMFSLGLFVRLVFSFETFQILPIVC